MPRGRRLWAALIWWGAVTLRAATIPLPAPGSAPLAAPLPAVVAFAIERQFPLTEIERGARDDTARVGDETISLITLFKAGAVSQWLARFRLVEATAVERGANQSEILRYSTTGAKHVFTSSVSAVDMQLFGPFHDGTMTGVGRADEKRARMLIRSDFLGLGLETWYSDVLVRSEAPQPRFLTNSYGPAPFPVEWIEKTNVIAREVGFTVAADRGAAGGELALLEFFAVANQTPGLREIAVEGVQRPSVWSYLNVGKVGWGLHWANHTKVVSRFDPQPWGWPPVPVYRGGHRLLLNGNVAAHVALFVTAPQPPLGMWAGIVGFTVETPKHSDRRVEMRVLAARRRG